MSDTGTLHLPPRPGPARPSSRKSRVPRSGDEAAVANARSAIEARLAAFALYDGASGRLGEAMRYSLLAPGKRLRPLICLFAARDCGGDERAALDAGCAIEMVHTASLVFDDLPAMDDATLRRGRSCTHVVFGESTAILAGISLLNRAFGITAGLRGVDESVRNRLVRELAQAVGAGGLSGGQQLDLTDRSTCSRVRDVDKMNHLKTGVLFVTAAKAGGLLGGADPQELDALGRYAFHFGRAFQNADDILDRSASPDEAGKDTGKDATRPTVASLAGAEEARRRIRQDLDRARKALAPCASDGSPLAALLDGLWARVHP